MSNFLNYLLQGKNTVEIVLDKKNPEIIKKGISANGFGFKFQ